MEITLYSQNNCETCTSLKEKLLEDNIYFIDKNIDDLSEDGQFERGKFLWEHKDLVDDFNLPPWVPKLIIKQNEKTNYVCVSDRNGIKGNISIFKTPDDGVKRIKEILTTPNTYDKTHIEVTLESLDKTKINKSISAPSIDSHVFQTDDTTIRYDILDKEEDSFKNIGLKHQADKAENGYLEIYEQYFKPLQNKKINILEIGVHQAASIRLWREWFKNAHIIGADVISNYEIVNSDHTRDYVEFDKVFQSLGNSSFFCGDAGNPAFLKKMIGRIIAKTGRGLDIIIDDGSHFQYDQMTTLGYLFPHLEAGGIYIIEDMCTASGLEKGSKWWGNEEEWRDDSVRWRVKASKQKKEWLPNGEKNTYYCSETTIERFEKTKIFDSAFLTKEQCNEITLNTDSISFYKALKSPITCSSSVGVLIKK